MAKSVATALPLNHYFLQSDEVRDASIEGLLYGNLSRNCTRFLDFDHQKAVEVYGHYKLPLSLKGEGIQLPNNRAAAIKRLKSLKRTFDQDDLLSKYVRNLWENCGERISKKM